MPHRGGWVLRGVYQIGKDESRDLGGRDCPGPRHPASVIDADDLRAAAGAPRHPLQVVVGHDFLGAGLGDPLRAVIRRDQVKDGGARRGARRAVDLAEGELDGATREAGTEGAVQVAHY